MFSIPDEKGRITQPNDNKDNGNIFASFGIDLSEGKIKVSEQSKIILNEQSTATFDGYAAAILPFSTNGSTGDLMALSDRAFKTNFDTPAGTWAISTSGTDPDGGNTVSDMEFFDGYLIASGSSSGGTGDLFAWNGSTWSDYWKGTLGQTGLTTGYRILLKRGADGNLYIVSGGNKLFKVDPATGAVTTGAGTLDFSATPYQFTCLARTSTRLFIGTKNLSGGNGVIVEWDMSPSSTTANKLHDIGAEGVRCIAVEDDRPYAVLSDGTIKYFDNVSFTDYKGFRFPVKPNQKLNENFIHPNGWDIIDNKIHFLVTGRTNSQTITTSEAESFYAMPSGVWCLDKEIGLYHRFALGANTGTQSDFGQTTINSVGALFATKLFRDTTTKFLASYEYRLANGTTTNAVLAYQDRADSLISRGFIITPFNLSLKETLKLMSLFHKPLTTGAKIKIYTRGENTDSVILSGTWSSTTTFNYLGINTGIEVGDIVFIKAGGGSGQWIKVIEIQESATVTTLTLEEANTYVTANDYGILESFNFKYKGVIDDTARDLHELNISLSQNKRKQQFLIEIIQPAGNKIEIDYLNVA